MIVFTKEISPDRYEGILDLIQNSNEDIPCLWLGRQEYTAVWSLQKHLHAFVVSKQIKGLILCLEHYSIYTLGRNADENNLLDLDIVDENVIRTDRGGDVTYHGPGQLVGYPIINLSHFKKSITWYIGLIEKSVIKYLKEIGIEAKQIKGLTGIWVNDRKICALGVRISRWTTMHGFALNFNTDIGSYDKIIPCGINHYGITSVQDEIGRMTDIKDQADSLYKLFCEGLYQGERCEV